ncbi:purine-cytosine permease family protein [Rhodopila sp.]|uniref:purine-cytosine permease family protein n=1 Tax=Rhodopila sp. TaxID=2480087 RepID=UPI003D14E538
MPVATKPSGNPTGLPPNGQPHAEAELEEKIRHHYHQPKGVEQFGIEPIPTEKRTVRWFDIFAIIFGFALNPGSIMTGGMAVVAGLSFQGAVVGITGGTMLAMVFYVIMATIGADYGIPGQVATRMTYGLRGAKYIPSLLRTIASTYWFAYQTVAGSIAVVAVLEHWTGTRFSLVTVSLIFGVLQAVVAIVGYDSLKFLSRAALPFKIIVLSYIMYLLMTHTDPNFAPAHVLAYAGLPTSNWVLFVTWGNAVAAGSITMVTDAADFCRYTRSRTDMWWGTLCGKFLGAAFACILGAYGAAATLGKVANVFDVVSGLTSAWPAYLAFLLVIGLDNWTINVLNLYTGGLSLSNMLERVGRFWTTLIISVLGVALSAVPDVVSSYTSYAGMLGNVFSPITGVLMADYLFVKKTRIDLPALFQPGGNYWYWRGFNPIAAVWTVLGFGIYMYVIPVGMMKTVSTVLLCGFGYWITTWLMSASWSALTRAARPVEQVQTVEELAWQLAER